jgi:hypothetical protein
MAGATSVGGSGARPQIKFDASKLSQTDRIMGVASLVLFISLFLPWFSAGNGIVSVSASALTAHGYLYVVLILALAAVLYFTVTALGVWSMPSSSPLPISQVLFVAAAIDLLLVVIAFIFKPSGDGIVNIGWSWGAFVGLIAAVVAVLPLGRPFIEARRKR